MVLELFLDSPTPLGASLFSYFVCITPQRAWVADIPRTRPARLHSRCFAKNIHLDPKSVPPLYTQVFGTFVKGKYHIFKKSALRGYKCWGGDPPRPPVFNLNLSRENTPIHPLFPPSFCTYYPGKSTQKILETFTVRFSRA